MFEEKQLIATFEATFDPLFAYIKRRVADEGVTTKLVIEVYQRFFDIPFAEEGKDLLTLYNLAFNVLKESHAIVFGPGFWAELSLLEGEILRLRYFENLNSVEIGFVIGESAGKVDALLYATLVKAQRLSGQKDINEYLKEEKNRQYAEVPAEIRYEIGKELFDREYNAARDFVLPQKEVPQEMGMKDFFTKPMTENEKEQFGVPDYWVPEDKDSALPKENPLGYGMDLLKTFMKKEDKQEEEFKPVYDVPQELSNVETVETIDELIDGQPDLSRIQKNILKYRSWISPLLALLVVVAFVWFFPMKNEVDKFAESYVVSYEEEISFDERKELVTQVLRDLVATRNIADIKVEKLTEKNFQVVFNLKDSDKQSELFVFYRLDDGRWAARKYQAIMSAT